jgi:hypothetical protein
MHRFTYLFIFLVPGCGLFSSPESQEHALLDDCTAKFQGWADDLKVSNEEDAMVILADVQEYQIERFRDWHALYFDLLIDLEGMEERDRGDLYKEMVDRMEDPFEDCGDAEDDFREELADNEDACEAYFEFSEDREDDWEKWDDEEEDRDEDCAGEDHCYSPDAISWFRRMTAVPSPEDVGSEDDCED